MAPENKTGDPTRLAEVVAHPLRAEAVLGQLVKGGRLEERDVLLCLGSDGRRAVFEADAAVAAAGGEFADVEVHGVFDEAAVAAAGVGFFGRGGGCFGRHGGFFLSSTFGSWLERCDVWNV